MASRFALETGDIVFADGGRETGRLYTFTGLKVELAALGFS